ncbi:hypothetical protein DITRI_Ditri04bG0103700 [Diplodiscus trichospermus]
MSNVEKCKRGFSGSDKCAFCSNIAENDEHIVQFCDQAMQVWQRLLPASVFQRLNLLSFEEWLKVNLIWGLKAQVEEVRSAFANKPKGLGGNGGEGLLRDMHGEWLKGFTLNIGRCGAAKAELWAVYRALEVAWNERYRKVNVELYFVPYKCV